MELIRLICVAAWMLITFDKTMAKLDFAKQQKTLLHRARILSDVPLHTNMKDVIQVLTDNHPEETNVQRLHKISEILHQRKKHEPLAALSVAKKPPSGGGGGSGKWFAKPAEPSEIDESKKAFIDDLNTFLDGQKLDAATCIASKRFIADKLAEIASWETDAMTRLNCARIYASSVYGSIIGVEPKISDEEIAALAATSFPEGFNEHHIDAFVIDVTDLRLSSKRGIISLMHLAKSFEAVPFFKKVPGVLEILQHETADPELNPSIHRLSELGNLIFGKTVFWNPTAFSQKVRRAKFVNYAAAKEFFMRILDQYLAVQKPVHDLTEACIIATREFYDLILTVLLNVVNARNEDHAHAHIASVLEQIPRRQAYMECNAITRMDKNVKLTVIEVQSAKWLKEHEHDTQKMAEAMDGFVASPIK